MSTKDYNKKTFIAILKPSKDLKNQWVAHCLDLDLVTQGNSISHAYNMMIEAINIIIKCSNDMGVESGKLAPEKYWSAAVFLASDGYPISDFAHSLDMPAAVEFYLNGEVRFIYELTKDLLLKWKEFEI